MAEDSTRPPHATRFIETTRGILSYAQLAPLLAERVLHVQEDIEEEVYASRLMDESLLLDMHREICADLTPDLAGRFRVSDVSVGQHSPPLFHQVPTLTRDYFADLNTRLESENSDDSGLLGTLAFAEGRLLSIHPFADFNGRATRLLLTELLRRKNLPPVDLAPSDELARERYIQALRAGDSLNWTPLAQLWQERLQNA